MVMPLCGEKGYYPYIHTYNSIQFNSILYYLRAESTAKRPITDTAQFNAGICIIEKNNNNNKFHQLS
jgi:hypothetical protein